MVIQEYYDYIINFTALEALGKHIGLLEKDNKQKQADIVNVIQLGAGVKPQEDE